MISLTVQYSSQALEDLKSIYEYIAYELLAPATAEGQVSRIRSAIRTLDNMPEKHKVYENEPWRSQGLRYFPVDNYLVFYIFQKKTKAVSVVRIIYGARDLNNQLKNMDETL